MKKHQTGAAIVELAIVLVLFLTVLLAIMDFGRILYTWNAAAEATRLGARVSVVCNNGGTNDGFAKVLADMQRFVPITSANLHIDWYVDNAIDNSCTSATCTGVAVSITGLSIAPVSPLAWIGFSSLSVPGFSTYLPREIMGQDPGSSSVCI
jgi:Flp pilus assembly protein TadG